MTADDPLPPPLSIFGEQPIPLLDIRSEDAAPGSVMLQFGDRPVQSDRNPVAIGRAAVLLVDAADGPAAIRLSLAEGETHRDVPGLFAYPPFGSDAPLTAREIVLAVRERRLGSDVTSAIATAYGPQASQATRDIGLAVASIAAESETLVSALLERLTHVSGDPLVAHLARRHLSRSPGDAARWHRWALAAAATGDLRAVPEALDEATRRSGPRHAPLVAQLEAIGAELAAFSVGRGGAFRLAETATEVRIALKGTSGLAWSVDVRDPERPRLECGRPSSGDDSAAQRFEADAAPVEQLVPAAAHTADLRGEGDDAWRLLGPGGDLGVRATMLGPSSAPLVADVVTRADTFAQGTPRDGLVEVRWGMAGDIGRVALTRPGAGRRGRFGGTVASLIDPSEVGHGSPLAAAAGDAVSRDDVDRSHRMWARVIDAPGRPAANVVMLLAAATAAYDDPFIMFQTALVLLRIGRPLAASVVARRYCLLRDDVPSAWRALGVAHGMAARVMPAATAWRAAAERAEAREDREWARPDDDGTSAELKALVELYRPDGTGLATGVARYRAGRSGPERWMARTATGSVWLLDDGLRPLRLINDPWLGPGGIVVEEQAPAPLRTLIDAKTAPSFGYYEPTEEGQGLQWWWRFR